MTKFKGHAWLALVALLTLASPLLAACGGDGNDGAAATPTVTGTATATGSSSPAPTPGGTALSDEGYLNVLCTGLTSYQESLNTAKTVGELSAVVTKFISSMQEVKPPADLVEFHTAFIQYLQGAVNDPTSLVTRAPPKPADAQRERLADKVLDVPACKYQTFLGEKRQP